MFSDRHRQLPRWAAEGPGSRQRAIPSIPPEAPSALTPSPPKPRGLQSEDQAVKGRTCDQNGKTENSAPTRECGTSPRPAQSCTAISHRIFLFLFFAWRATWERTSDSRRRVRISLARSWFAGATGTVRSRGTRGCLGALRGKESTPAPALAST